MHLKEPSLWSFLVANRTYDPATLPLYYTIEYLWSCLVGSDTLLLRIPSVLMGLATIPATYLLGAALLSRRSGLLVAACVAFSPIHIFHSQGIRMYVLFTLLAVVSMYTYVQLRKDNGKRWHHAIAQLLLSWTHPFAVLIPVVQGLAWLFSPSRERPGMFAWGFLTAAAWLPALLYLMTIRYYPQDVTNWIALPDLQGFFHDLFQDDVVRSGYQVFASERAWMWLPFGAGALARGMAPAMDWALTLVILLALPLFAWVTHRQGRSNTLLLALWAFAPVFILLAASFLLRPMIAPRYTVHSSIALYLMVAGVVAALPGWRFRCSAAVICLLLLYQVTWMHPGPQRTNYVGAVRMIRDHPANPEDVVIVTSEFERKIFEYNYRGAKLPILHVEGYLLAYLLANEVVSQAGQQGTPVTAWVFHVIPYFGEDAQPGPSEILPALGLAWEERVLPAVQWSRLTRITRSDSTPSESDINELFVKRREEIEQRLPPGWLTKTVLGVEPGGSVLGDIASSPYLLGLSRKIDPGVYDFFRTLPEAAGEPGDLLQRRERALRSLGVALSLEEGIASPEHRPLVMESIAADPSFGAPHMVLGFEHTLEGRLPEALGAFTHACAIDQSTEKVMGDFVRALQTKNYPAALEAAKTIRVFGSDDIEFFTGVAQKFGESWGLPIQVESEPESDD
jgi:hypothetical protein